MSSNKVPDKDLKAVSNAFMGMYKDPKGKDILHKASQEVGLDKDAYFVSATDADYASYRRFFQTAPASLN